MKTSQTVVDWELFNEVFGFVMRATNNKLNLRRRSTHVMQRRTCVISLCLCVVGNTVSSSEMHQLLAQAMQTKLSGMFPVSTMAGGLAPNKSSIPGVMSSLSLPILPPITTTSTVLQRGSDVNSDGGCGGLNADYVERRNSGLRSSSDKGNDDYSMANGHVGDKSKYMATALW